MNVPRWLPHTFLHKFIDWLKLSQVRSLFIQLLVIMSVKRILMFFLSHFVNCFFFKWGCSCCMSTQLTSCPNWWANTKWLLTWMKISPEKIHGFRIKCLTQESWPNICSFAVSLPSSFNQSLAFFSSNFVTRTTSHGHLGLWKPCQWTGRLDEMFWGP